jgi:hypothetical protein
MDRAARAEVSVPLGGVINRVTRDLNDQTANADIGLAGKPGFRLQPPRLVEVIFLEFVRLIQRIKPFTDYDVTSRAGTRHFAGMLDIDIVTQQRLTDALAHLRCDHSALRADLVMR